MSNYLYNLFEIETGMQISILSYLGLLFLSESDQEIYILGGQNIDIRFRFGISTQFIIYKR